MRLNYSSLAIMFASVLVCVVLSGCTGPRATDPAYLLTISGTPSIDVECFGGDVEVIVDDELQDEASITVTRHANFGKGRNDDAKAALETIAWTAQLDDSTSPATLRVTTNTTHPEPHFLRTHIEIRIAASSGVRIRTSRGDIEARNVRGPIDLQTTEGNVRVMTNWAIREPVTIITNEGSIDYRIRGDSTGAIDAETVNGQALARVRFGRFLVRNPTPGKLIASLNDGSNPVILRTTDDDIRIAVIHNPTEVSPLMIDP